MADDRSVDMDERRDPPADDGSSTPDIAADERPTPAQARRAYAKHVNNECARCRDVDRDRCDDGDRLYRAWVGACEAAYRQLADQTP